MIDPKHHGWAQEVLDFWFKELEPKDWFSKSDALDTQIKSRFADLHDDLSQVPPDVFLKSVGEAFGAIILFDQLSRNLFRESAKAFDTDESALAIARGMISKGWDSEISEDQRVFVYLPFEHSENLGDQDTAVRLISTLGDDQYTAYAKAHRDVIERFGRFPHRNAVLGRASTPEESAYLSQPGSGF